MKIIYTDGSTRKNGLKNAEGGFGVIICEAIGKESPEQYHVIDAYAEKTIGTTNNRMEMSAILWAFRNYGGEEHWENGILYPIVYSDSQYCVNTFNTWANNWKNNGWKRPGNKNVENLDLVKEWFNILEKGKRIELRYIKGHSGKIWNEVADQLATGKITVEQVIKQYGNR